jgi:hypothetical protein
LCWTHRITTRLLNGKVERKHDTLKSLARPMVERSGLHLSFWYFAIQHAALVSNLVLPARDDDGEEMPITIWEAEYDVEPEVERYLLGPFGCLAYLILTEEQRRAKGLCKHFGIRSIAGVYLGCAVDVDGTYKHHSRQPSMIIPVEPGLAAHRICRSARHMPLSPMTSQP